MNVTLELLTKISSFLKMPDKYFYVKCPECDLPCFFNLLDTKCICRVLAECGGCESETTIDLLPLKTTPEFESMVESRLKEWVGVRETMERNNPTLPIPSLPFTVDDTRLVRLSSGDYMLFHKNETVFDHLGINPKLKQDRLNEVI